MSCCAVAIFSVMSLVALHDNLSLIVRLSARNGRSRRTTSHQLIPVALQHRELHRVAIAANVTPTTSCTALFGFSSTRSS